MIWLAIAVAGGLGAAARFLVDAFVTARLPSPAPWGTVIVNVSGSFAAGLVAGSVATGGMAGSSGVVVAGGFLGAYTTFSTAMVQAAEPWLDERRTAGLVNLIGTLLACVVAAGVGSLVTGS